MAKLKPCPFCGDEAEERDGYPWALVICTSCGGRMMCVAIERAVRAWNRRHKDSYQKSCAFDPRGRGCERCTGLRTLKAATSSKRWPRSSV